MACQEPGEFVTQDGGASHPWSASGLLHGRDGTGPGRRGQHVMVPGDLLGVAVRERDNGLVEDGPLAEQAQVAPGADTPTPTTFLAVSSTR